MSLSTTRRKGLVEPGHAQLSITKQCELLSINRSAYYYQPVGESPQNMELMRLIDKQHLETPWYGARQKARHLRREGHAVNSKRISRLMQLMGLSVIYQKSNTSKPHPQHKEYPHLLRVLTIDRSNKVWCADICYIPLRRVFLYLVATMDWFSQNVLSCCLSNTMDADFCDEALEDALARFCQPEIFNTDQGSQFTSNVFTCVLKESNVRISMDGKGRWRVNIMIERLWRFLKCECIYLYALETGSEVRQVLKHWIEFYNTRRPHPSLDDRTPYEAYWQKNRLGSAGRLLSLAA